MKKVININFQGRVIPIEESAYDILKQYTESLSKFFANEEGKDEIINDIEGRIAELFGETLKKGSTCISDDDINKIMASIGKPEDFETEEVNVQEQLGGNKSNYNSSNTQQDYKAPKERLYRDENDKILGGVCGGLANYLRIDASIIRILIVLLTLGAGTGILIYILMWIILPSRKLNTNMTKRLYRNPDEKVLGGVASGLSAYFNIAVWIPRIIFAFPLVIGILNSIFHNIFWNFSPFPSVVFGSFGGSLTLIYLILWGVIPEANTASEKLEMRGDKIDLNSIKNTIQTDLDGFKDRAERYSKDLGEKAKKWGNEFGENAKTKSEQFGTEVNYAARTAGNRIGHGFSVIFKAFGIFICGMIAFALLMLVLKLMFGGFNFFPLKNYVFTGVGQNILLWTTIIGLLCIPVVAFVVWVIRRLIKTKVYSKQISATFGIAWSIGLFAGITLLIMVANDFKNKNIVEDSKFILKQPSVNKLYVNVGKDNLSNSYNSRNVFDFTFDDEFDDDRDIESFNTYGKNSDSILLRDVRINLAKSSDENYHMKLFKISRGGNTQEALTRAEEINFPIVQNDSVITLPTGYFVTQQNKFRNQEVLIIIEIPQGKKIEMDGGIDIYSSFSFHLKRKQRISLNWKDKWDYSLHWDKDREMMMTKDKLVNTKPDRNDNNEEENWNTTEENSNNDESENSMKVIDEKQKKIEQLRDSLEKIKKEKEAIKVEKKNTVKAVDSNNSNITLGNILLDKFSI